MYTHFHTNMTAQISYCAALAGCIQSLDGLGAPRIACGVSSQQKIKLEKSYDMAALDSAIRASIGKNGAPMVCRSSIETLCAFIRMRGWTNWSVHDLLGDTLIEFNADGSWFQLPYMVEMVNQTQLIKVLFV